MSEEIMRIKVKADGEVTIRVKNVAGPGCKNVSKAIVKALGTVIEDKKTSDFYEMEGGGDDQHHQNRA